MSYPSLLNNVRTDAFQSGNSRGEQALPNYENDVEFLLSYNDGDWSKAVSQAKINISWAYEAERNKEPLPYSHRDYENILSGTPRSLQVYARLRLCSIAKTLNQTYYPVIPSSEGVAGWFVHAEITKYIQESVKKSQIHTKNTHANFKMAKISLFFSTFAFY